MYGWGVGFQERFGILRGARSAEQPNRVLSAEVCDQWCRRVGRHTRRYFVLFMREWRVVGDAGEARGWYRCGEGLRDLEFEQLPHPAQSVTIPTTSWPDERTPLRFASLAPARGSLFTMTVNRLSRNLVTSRGAGTTNA